MAEEIIIEIEDGGAVKITVNGCTGPSCKLLTAKIEQALGTVTEDKKTRDYYVKTENQAHNRR